MRSGVLLLFAFVAPLTSGVDSSFLDHRKLHWTGPCLVKDVDTPCRTVRYRQHMYGAHLNGFSDAEIVETVDRDGSTSSRHMRSFRPWWLLSETRTDTSILRLHNPDQSIALDHRRRTFESWSHAPGGSPIWELDDRYCTHAASHYLYLEKRLGDQRKIAGYSTVFYTGRDDGGDEYELGFAPDLGCQILSYSRVERGFMGIPVSKDERVVTSFLIGEPSPELLAVPKDYVRMSSILEGK